MAERYIPIKEKKETDWISREKRELFAKAVNSILMTNSGTSLDDALKSAKEIVDTAFLNYPDTDPNKEEELESPL